MNTQMHPFKILLLILARKIKCLFGSHHIHVIEAKWKMDSGAVVKRDFNECCGCRKYHKENTQEIISMSAQMCTFPEISMKDSMTIHA